VVKIEFVFSSAKAWLDHYDEVVKYIGDKIGHVVNADDNERWSEPERGEWGGCTFADVSHSDASQFARAANQAGMVPGSAELSVHRVQR
jgi:hypothetical protein